MGNTLLNVGEMREKSGKKSPLPKAVIANNMKRYALTALEGDSLCKKQVSDQKIYLNPSCICQRDGRSGLAWKVLFSEGSNV